MSVIGSEFMREIGRRFNGTPAVIAPRDSEAGNLRKEDAPPPRIPPRMHQAYQNGRMTNSTHEEAQVAKTPAKREKKKPKKDKPAKAQAAAAGAGRTPPAGGSAQDQQE